MSCACGRGSQCLFVYLQVCMGGHTLDTHMHTHKHNNLSDRLMMWVANRQTGKQDRCVAFPSPLNLLKSSFVLCSLPSKLFTSHCSRVNYFTKSSSCPAIMQHILYTVWSVCRVLRFERFSQKNRKLLSNLASKVF